MVTGGTAAAGLVLAVLGLVGQRAR